MEKTSSRPRHRFFSSRRLLALTGSTFTQLVRMRVFYFLLLFSLLILAGTRFLHFLTEQGMQQDFELRFAQQLKVLKDLALFVMSVFCSLFAIAATATLIPRDLEDRTLYTILSKPVPRYEYLLGKYLGVLLVILVSLTVMSVLFFIMLYLRQETIVGEELATLGDQADGDYREAIKVTVARYGVNASLVNAIVAIFLKAAVAGALCLLVSTFASSTLFTMIVTFIIFAIGHVQPLLIEYWEHTLELGATGRGLTGIFAAVFPNFQVFDIVDGVVSGEPVKPEVMKKMTALACGHIVVYNVVASLFFGGKEL